MPSCRSPSEQMPYVQWSTIGVVGPVELGRQPPLGDGHPDGVGEALAERAGRRLDAGRQAVLGMARRPRAPLAERLEVVEVEVVARQVEERVEEHARVAGRQDEAVAVRPVGRPSVRGAGSASRARRPSAPRPSARRGGRSSPSGRRRSRGSGSCRSRAGRAAGRQGHRLIADSVGDGCGPGPGRMPRWSPGPGHCTAGLTPRPRHRGSLQLSAALRRTTLC